MSTGRNRISLVTGATGGIGLEIARQMLKRGDIVVLTGRTRDKAQAAANTLAPKEPRLFAHALDVEDDASIATAVKDVENQFGHLDVLINNAGGGYDQAETAMGVDLNAVRRTIEMNLFGAWRVTRAFVPLMKRSAHPRVVNVSSGAGSHADLGFGLNANKASLPGYAVSKAALNALTEILAKELKADRFLVNAACPGFTNSHPEKFNMPDARPVDVGAASILWCADLPDGGPTGGFFRDGKALGW